MPLIGQSFIADARTNRQSDPFRAIDAQSGEALAPDFFPATPQDVTAAVSAAELAFQSFRRSKASARAAFLRRIAGGLEARSAELAARAHQETALPLPRLEGEVLRTGNQLRLFAAMVEDGTWLNARIDTALPERKPLPRPDLRSMLSALGPVAVFGASNFPLAFSVAGGDTASALAAGNPVIVKAHPAHPGTSEIAAEVIASAVTQAGFHPGVFSLLFDSGNTVGEQLVKHPGIQAIAFTGSHKAGRALMDLAAARPKPIPCFTEMSSLNPVFVLPSVTGKISPDFGKGLFASFTLGAGQFCTKPGMVLLPDGEAADALQEELRQLTRSGGEFTMLTPGIAAAFRRSSEQRQRLPVQQTGSSNDFAIKPVLYETDPQTYAASPALHEEMFGPSTVLITCQAREDMLRVAEQMEGHLTATIFGSDEDIAAHMDLIAILERKVGRLLVNGFPTGVEVSYAMVHGGPYPATSDARFTSVGAQAILRFARPICYQNFPQAALPEELRDGNPHGLLRLIDGIPGRE